MNKYLPYRLVTLIIITLLFISACGGSSGGGTPAQNNPGEQETGGPGDPVSSGGYFCPSHITMDNTVIGNNVYQFQADDGQCFGTVEDHGLVKRVVPVVAQPGTISPISYSSLSLEAKLTTNSTSLILGGGEHQYLSFKVTNNHSSVICLEFAGATLADSNDAPISEIEVEVMGDSYFGERASRFRFSTDCIAAGATRFVWGSRLSGINQLEAGGLSAIDHVNVSYQVREPETVDLTGLPPEVIDLLPQRPEAYFPSALVPTAASWSSGSETILGSVYHFYDNPIEYLNMTDQAVTIDFRSSDFIYMDEDDYIVYVISGTLDNFLEIDNNDLTASDYRLEAMGGSAGFATRYNNVLPDTNGDATITGRATKILMALELCHGLEVGAQCSVRN